MGSVIKVKGSVQETVDISLVASHFSGNRAHVSACGSWIVLCEQVVIREAG